MTDKKPRQPKKAGTGRRRRKPAGQSTGLAATDLQAAAPPGEVASLHRTIEEDGGRVLAVYREPYGGEVAYDAWRKQFRGKSAADSLRVGREIRSISGATISAHAVTLGVRRLLADLTRWHRRGAIR